MFSYSVFFSFFCSNMIQIQADEILENNNSGKLFFTIVVIVFLIFATLDTSTLFLYLVSVRVQKKLGHTS